MRRTKLRFFIAPVWIINIILLFGTLFSIFQNEEGKLSYLALGLIGLPFIFFIYLFQDITTFKRELFLKIIIVCLLVSTVFHIVFKNYLIIPILLLASVTLFLHIKKRFY